MSERKHVMINIDHETHAWIVADEHWLKDHATEHARALSVTGGCKAAGHTVEEAVEAMVCAAARLAGHQHMSLATLLEQFTNHYKMEEARAHVREKTDQAIAADLAKSVDTTLPVTPPVEAPTGAKWN